MVELVDHTYDNRRVVAGRIVYYTPVDLTLLFRLLWVCCRIYIRPTVVQDFDWHSASRGQSSVAEFPVFFLFLPPTGPFFCVSYTFASSICINLLCMDTKLIRSIISKSIRFFNQSVDFLSGLSGATTARTTSCLMSVDDVRI